jgi:DNA-binding NtrC family response regulator
VSTAAPFTTRLLGAGRGPLEIDAAELKVVAGPDRGAHLELGVDTLRIGSSASCDLVLHDHTVSSRHAAIVMDGGGYSIHDLGSKNGVRLGPTFVTRAPIHDGARIVLGDSALLVRARGGSRTLPLAQPGRLSGLVAYSLKMRAVAALLERFAGADTTVLIEGETGTGKEVAAHAIHRASPRAGGPYVVFDCGAVSPHLLAAELFGHERGAFTGADAARAGALEQADGGTLFLDEIGELPLDLQPAFLRLLETRTIRRVGGVADLPCDVRFVAATHRNLAEEVREGRFRADLFHRLAVARVRLPPLAERPEDIRVLAELFAVEAGVTLSPEILAVLAAHDWPGNVRELRNSVARLAIAGHPFDPLDPPRAGRLAWRAPPGDFPTLADARRAAQDDLERSYLEEALRLADGSVTRAADLAGVSRQQMTRLAAKHGLRVRDRG